MAREGLSEKVLDRLKELVLANHIRPGERLLDRDLAKLLGVSRTPVREALVRLHQDGLLETRDGRGYFVIDIQDARQIGDLYDLRETLEVQAVHLAAQRASVEDLAELEELLATLESFRDDPQKRREEVTQGLRVHEIIARASGNGFLHETITRLLNRMRFFIWIETLYENVEEAEDTRREHGALLTLLREHRAEEAEAIVRAHLRKARDHIVRIVQLREAFYPEVDLSPIGALDGRRARARAGRGRSATKPLPKRAGSHSR